MFASPAPAARGVATCAGGQSLVGFHERSGKRYDGVEATIAARGPISGLQPRQEGLAGIVWLGNSNESWVEITLGSIVNGDRFRPVVEWRENGQDHVLPLTNVPHLPWRVDSAHALRIDREGATSSWNIEVDGQRYFSVSLDGTSGGLPFPIVDLVTRNLTPPCNSGLFSFADLHVRAAGERDWVPFPLTTTFADQSRGYRLLVLDRKTFFAGSPDLFPSPGSYSRMGRPFVAALAAVGAFVLFLIPSGFAPRRRRGDARLHGMKR
jgi:hypothetical protein